MVGNLVFDKKVILDIIFTLLKVHRTLDYEVEDLNICNMQNKNNKIEEPGRSDGKALFPIIL